VASSRLGFQGAPLDAVAVCLFVPKAESTNPFIGWPQAQALARRSPRHEKSP
jgi:hypothetical protein